MDSDSGASARQQDSLRLLQEGLADRYQIEGELRHGGTAVVYLARDLKHHRKVALKVLRPELAALVGPERFLREIEIAAQLNHPHILPLHDSGEAAGFLYFVMPFVEGESLRDRMVRQRQLPLDDVVRIAQNVGHALGYAHRIGVIHRDIKPENIMMSGDEAVVADFGIARAIDEAGAERLTFAGTAVGTLVYMSPEQAAAVPEIDGRADIYSLGCVTYEMLTGSLPHLEPRPPERGSASTGEGTRTGNPPVPEAIMRVAKRAMSSHPADRYATAEEFVGELTRAHRNTLDLPDRKWRSVLRSLAVVVPLAIALFLASRIIGRPRPITGPANNRVAVLPFTYHGTESYEHLGNGIVVLLSGVLDGVADLRTADPSAVLGLVQQESGGPLPPERAGTIAAKLGVRRYVVGSIDETAGRVTLSATAYDLSARPSEVARAVVEAGATGSIGQLVNDLAVRLLGAFGVQESPRRLESISTASVVALNEYLKGEAALRGGDFLAAVPGFRNAVAADSLFALAWYRLGYALNITEGAEAARRPARRAVELGQRLSAHDRRLAEAHLAVLQADADLAERLYRSLLLDYPDDLEAQNLLALLMVHFGPLRGLDMTTASAGFRRVLSFDPHNTQALLFLPFAAALVGDVAGADSALSRSLALDPAGALTPVYSAIRAYARGDRATAGQAVAALGPNVAGAEFSVVVMAALFGHFEEAKRLALRFYGPGQLREVQSFGLTVGAALDLARGRWRSAREQLRETSTHSPQVGLEYRVLFALMPLLATPASELEVLRSELRGMTVDESPSRIGNIQFDSHEGMHGLLRQYLLGCISAQLGDRTAALRYAAELESRPETSLADSPARTLAHSVRAMVDLKSGQSAEAIAKLDRAELLTLTARTRFSPFFSQSYERYLRAGALADLGRSEEALRWYRSVWMQNVFDLIYLAPSSLRQAEIYERLDRREEALKYYRQFVDLWQDADVELRPLVDTALSRMQRLGS